jgi:hypothetical protein|tara:strand:+ start:1503 stop:3308 length:1806 start_codon:yes stop_codon:yes gene_type:complete
MALSEKQITGIIETHRAKSREERRDWDKWRAWYLSEYWGGDAEQPSGSYAEGGAEEINFQTNYPYAYIDTMIANICPQNPQVTVMARQKALRENARFRESLINDCFQRNELHQLLWKFSTSAAICGRAFMKTVWNFKKGTTEFFTVDPRFIFFDMSAAKWKDIRYLVEVTVLTEAEFKQRAEKKGKKGTTYNKKVAEKAVYGGYPTWLRDASRNSSMLNEASHDVYKWVTVYEVYDFEGDGKYYHMLDNVETPLFEGDLPYRYVRNPFAYATFNENMTDLGGLSDIKLIQSLQERLNEIDTLELWHAHSATPVMMVNTALADNPEEMLTALREANQPGSMIQVQGKANAPLRDIIEHTPIPQMTPSFDKMRERCTQVVEFILGIPQYSRGVVGVADVATEIALADTATRTRNGRRIKLIEDVVRELALRVVGLYEEFLGDDTILPVRLTGSQKVLEVSRESLAMKEERSPEEHPMEYDYTAIPYSPTENHRLVQLQKLQQYLPMLIQSPMVDQEKLVVKLLELLQLQEVVSTAPPPPPAPAAPPAGAMPPGAPPGMPPGAPPMPPEGPPVDSVASGGMPIGPGQPTMPLPAGGPGMPVPGI